MAKATYFKFCAQVWPQEVLKPSDDKLSPKWAWSRQLDAF